MNKDDLVRQVIGMHLEERPYFTDDPFDEGYHDTLIEIGCYYYYGGDEMEGLARYAFQDTRWKGGAHCPRCLVPAWELRGHGKYECSSCGYQFRVTTRTVFHKLRIPIYILVGFVMLCEGFRWKRGTRLWLSKLNPDIDMHEPISWPTAWRLWNLALVGEWDTSLANKWGNQWMM